jgi:hypothetical protein
MQRRRDPLEDLLRGARIERLLVPSGVARHFIGTPPIPEEAPAAAEEPPATSTDGHNVLELSGGADDDDDDDDHDDNDGDNEHLTTQLRKMNVSALALLEGITALVPSS